ncbi:MAG: hypothetical protein AB2L22_17910 [Syntrophales bacterium]
MAKGKEFRQIESKRTKRFNIKDDIRKDHIDYDLCRPIFSFLQMPYGSKNCLSCCEQSDKSAVTDTLLRLSQLTWRQISSQPKTGLGYEKIPQKRFQVTLPISITPEVTIKVFRYSDGGRMAGYRDRDIYHIIIVGEELYHH